MSPFLLSFLSYQSCNFLLAFFFSLQSIIITIIIANFSYSKNICISSKKTIEKSDPKIAYSTVGISFSLLSLLFFTRQGYSELLLSVFLLFAIVGSLYVVKSENQTEQETKILPSINVSTATGECCSTLGFVDLLNNPFLKKLSNKQNSSLFIPLSSCFLSRFDSWLLIKYIKKKFFDYSNNKRFSLTNLNEKLNVYLVTAAITINIFIRKFANDFFSFFYSFFCPVLLFFLFIRRFVFFHFLASHIFENSKFDRSFFSRSFFHFQSILSKYNSTVKCSACIFSSFFSNFVLLSVI
jgi:hypothetical protein